MREQSKPILMLKYRGLGVYGDINKVNEMLNNKLREGMLGVENPKRLRVAKQCWSIVNIDSIHYTILQLHIIALIRVAERIC
ncbi:hypothetical protein BABINDRAFT_113944 [Babjeviella inositovora NRRL Y-12698]|uniref:Uncharacterized protein n=1 Tax=Babjeviella inositovora NRRL Y-12698 TaxID=984486 RepID=A0A1E3QWB4_9ASCO|nr:uncharacterized protein BABINDRAFT_113944 [Babjeviella inositovora NRRL Y-12698]ODQ81969.1 hypothetical protein BABINDRAFT_113944 [Babjeviella inositovora NRRL Y-12698]